MTCCVHARVCLNVCFSAKLCLFSTHSLTVHMLEPYTHFEATSSWASDKNCLLVIICVYVSARLRQFNHEIVISSSVLNVVAMNYTKHIDNSGYTCDYTVIVVATLKSSLQWIVLCLCVEVFRFMHDIITATLYDVDTLCGCLQRRKMHNSLATKIYGYITQAHTNTSVQHT